MTPEDGAAGLATLAAAVEEAIPAALRREWERHVAHEPVLVARQGIFAGRGRPLAYQLSYCAPDSLVHPSPVVWGPRFDERATAHVLGATFGRADLEHVAQGRLLFVRCPRAYLVGDLPVPSRPDRLVIEIGETTDVDEAVLAGVRRLRADGFRVCLADFVGATRQRLLLPHADFVKIDVRDLDVEGYPVVEHARAFGALLVAEHVEDATVLRSATDAGFNLFQGDLLERADVLDRTGARRVSL